MLWFLKYFRRNIWRKMAFFAQTTACFFKYWSRHWSLRKNANFFAENCQKLQKIVIITSTPASCLEDCKGAI
jgi:hypothetical protein